MKQKQGLRAIQAQRYLRYSIRKFTVGVASVAIATGLMMFGANVQAAEEGTSATVQQTNLTTEKTGENINKEGKVDKTNTENKLDKVTNDNKVEKVSTVNKVAVNVDELQKKLLAIEEKLAQLPETKETKSAIDAAKEVVKKANKVLNEETKTQESVNAVSKELSSQLTILNSMKTEIDKEEKEHKNNDSRNGKAIPGNGKSGFREAATTNPIIPATEGPTNNNKLGSGNNPADGVFESAKDQFGDIDFSNATEKNVKVEKQWSRSNASQGGETKLLTGGITYKWKEKEITATEANNNNALNGWKIEGGEKVTAVKPETPTADAGREAEYQGKPSKAYDNHGSINRNYNNPEHPTATNPLGVNASNQNYANGVNYSGMVGTHNLPKGYYLELGKKGTKISKEYAVNGNSRVMLSAITGGAYGNAGTAGTGEKLKITVYDEKGNKISSIRDDKGIGTKYETEHISSPTGNGGNGDGWSEYRAIYEIPQDVKKIKVEIEALDEGDALTKINPKTGKPTYSLGNGKTGLEDGYFVGAVNLAVGTGTEMTTNVKTNGKEGRFGEDNLYKSKQKGELEFTVNSVGGIRHYGSAETEIEVPEGVDLPENITNPKDWVWFGDTPVAPKNISWDATTRKLRIKYQTSGNNAGVNPYIGIGSNNGKNDGVRKFRLPFTTTDNYRGTATFKVRTYLPNGLSDGQDNQLLNTGDVSNADGKYHPVVNGLRNTDQPDYYYNKTIYIDTKRPDTPTVEAVHTDSIGGDKKDKNQVKELLVSIPTKNTDLTNEAREKKDVAENDKNNGVDRAHMAGAETVDKAVDKIGAAIGGLTSMKVTLPNNQTPITLTKKEDGWYIGTTKVEERDGKLVVPVPAGTDLTEANETTNPDKRIKVTVLDKAGNESDPSYANVLNEAPTVAVEKKDLYVYKTKETDKWNNDKVLEKAKPSATDLEDDRDGIESTKPTIAVSDAGNLDTTKVGDYTVKVQSIDSEGKKSTETTVTVHVLDLIKVDPTVTTDPTDPSTTSPVSPKAPDTPVKPGDENLGKYPAGLTREDLVKEVTRTIKYLKEDDANKADATGLKPDKVQKVTYKRTATVNPETKEVTYSEWEVYNETDKLVDSKADGTKGKFNAVDSPVVDNYLLVNASDKTVAEKEAPVPTQDGTVTPEVTKVLYKEIGSFTPKYPEDKKPNGAQDKIPYPNNPNDPTVPGDFSKVVIPYVEGYVPTYNGVELTPVNPADLSKGYKVPDNFNPTDKFGETPIQYAPGIQKATVNFVSIDANGKETAIDEKFNITSLTGKAGTKIPEDNIQARIDVLKSMGYTVKENPFDQNPTFDSNSDTDQNFTIKLTPKVSTTNPVYVLEGNKPSAEKLKNAVITEGNDKTVDETKIPETTGKVGDNSLTVPVTVTYGSGNNKREEIVNVPVKVLPKPVPKGVTVLNGTSNEKLIDAIRANVKKAIDGLTNVPEGVTPFVTDDAIVTPKTDKNGQQKPVTVTVKYRDNATRKIIDDISVNVDVPVNVVGSTPASKVVFEGDELTAKDITDAVTPGEKGTKGKPKDLAKDITAKPGVKEVTVPVIYTNQNGETLTEPVKVKVTVLPKPTPKGIFVAKDSDKEKAKEKALAKAKESIEDGTFKGKLPDNVTNVSIDENVDNPDLSDDTDVNVTVKYTVDGEEKRTVVKVPVTVVEGVPQIVPVDENNKQPNPENSIDKTEYPEGSTFEYDSKSPVDTTTPGDYTVNVIVKDKAGNPIAEVPATVRVVESYPQFVPVDKDKKQPSVEGSIDPKAFPKDTEFTYETPVDTTTPGEKDVVVVAKIGDKVIAKIPAKVMVVEPKTQYVPVDKSNKQPDAAKSIDPEQYPDGVTFKYKTPVDTTTPGEKDVIVEAKDGEDKLVEVPAKVKVVEGKEQLIPVNPTEKPQARDNITPSDYPEGSTFEYKVPGGQTEPFDATTVGDKPVTVVVKDKNGNVLVEVPATIKVVEAKPKPIETPVTNTPLTKDDITKYVKVPEGGKVTNVENIPDLTTPGKKDPVKVTVTLPNGKTTTVDVPVNVTPVKGIETPVTKTPLQPEDYTKGIKIPEGGKVTNVENIPDLTTPGKKDPVKVTVELPNRKTVTVDVPVEVTPVRGIETPVTKTPLKPEDYTKGIKIPEGGKVTNVENIPDLTTPGKKDPVKVTVELPNGKTITVEVPVNVTPATGITTPVTDTPLTKEDIEKHVKVPEGGKVVEVGKIPEVNTPGDKGTVKVKIELPNGKQIEVEVPVKVTPIKDIVKKLGDPITNEDVEKHIQIPKGGKIISIGDKPSTDVPGERPSVPVVIELPGGKRVTVKVPVIVTPKTTPVVVEVETPITEDMVKKHVDLPEGWKITKVGEIPETNTPGDKPSVTVEIELPDGRKVTVDVPVKVLPKGSHTPTPNSTPSTPTTKVTTHFVDENGKDITTPEEGVKEPKVLEGYEYKNTTTDENGNKVHHYKKAVVAPSVDPSSTENNDNHHSTDDNSSNQVSSSNQEGNSSVGSKQELPNTGESEASLFTPAVLAILSGLGIVIPTVRKKKDEE